MTSHRTGRTWLCALAAAAIAVLPLSSSAEVTPFGHALAVAASQDDALSAFYRERGYAALWTGDGDDQRARRAALLTAVSRAGLHGLPAARFDARALRLRMGSVRDARGAGRMEVEMSRLMLDFARAMRSGVLDPADVVPDIKRRPPQIDEAALLRDFARSDRPHAFLDALAPASREYLRLVRESARMREVVATGGWGPRVPGTRVQEGMSGPAVVALRDRLVAMGYLRRSAVRTFGPELRRAVEAFQSDHGLEPDGVVGGATLQALNMTAQSRLGQILVAMERERWLGAAPEGTHVLVNLTDFHAAIVSDGETVFETKSVIGKSEAGRRTPEFSDVMEYMVINPSWYVPRSIVVEEYLPALRRNPYALAHMDIIDRRGRTISRAQDFSRFTDRTFPYGMKQGPGPRNALGRVKFIFPNKYNIYLHDTPAKNLFGESVRAFSHGCVRLAQPFEFAYALLAMQEDDPVGFFQRHLRSGRESRVNLKTALPVHLIYRTAVAKPGGGMQFRRDVYDRDRRILLALQRAGVVSSDLRS